MPRLQELLGVELPVIQSPMAGVQGSALAVAVCNAGGLGSLPAALLDIDDLRAELTAIRAQTTKPFNVNFFCHARAAGRRAPGGGVAGRARALLRRARHRPEHDPARPEAITLQPGSRECAGRLRAGRRQLSFRAARRRSAGARARLGREGAVVRDDGRRGALAGGPRRGRHHRAGSRGGRASGDVSVRRRRHAGRHAGAGPADRRRGEGTGHRRGRHRGRARRPGGDGAGCERRPGRNRLPALPRNQEQPRASRGPQDRRRARHRADERLHRASGPRAS